MKSEEKQRIIKATRDYAAEHDVELWHDSERNAWASVPEKGGYFENWPVLGRDFRLWATATLFDILNAPPPKSLVYDVIEEFEVWAVCRCPEYSKHIRIAPAKDGGLLIDLADKARHVCEIQGDAVSLQHSNGIKFIRTKGMDSLPFPADGAGGLNWLNLNRFTNLNRKHELLFYTWLTNCLRPSGPYPALVLSGVQGSGKSTLTKIVRALIDPSIVALTSLPGETRDLAIAAQNSHFLAFDNVSKITTNLSDGLCMLATGAAFRKRKLYTSDEETLLRFCKPVLINGIENLVLRPDLLDRSILIHMEPIEPKVRQTEAKLWSDFQESYSDILGAFYRTIGEVLPLVDEIRLDNPPRMADFAAWGCAIEKVLGYPEGQFLADYAANREEGNALALEASPIAGVIRDYLLQEDKFSGTAKELLQSLTRFIEANEHGKQKGVLRHPDWPKAPSMLSALIARIEPNLATEGIAVSRSRNGNNKIIKLTKEN